MAYTPYQPSWTGQYLQWPSVGQTQWPSMGQTLTTLPTNGIVKVNGRDSALQYQLPPNSMSPALFDQNGKVFYVVSTDGTGAKTVEVFDFSPHVDEEPVRVDGAEFVSRSEYDQFVAKVSAALEAINGTNAAVQQAEPARQGSRAKGNG